MTTTQTTQYNSKLEEDNSTIAIEEILENLEDRNIDTENVDIKINNFSLSPAKRFGPVFKKSREEQNISLVDVSSRIKLNQRQLESIENGDWDKLPSDAFVRGALRSYAKYLNVDIEPILQEYIRFHEKDMNNNTQNDKYSNQRKKTDSKSIQTFNTMGSNSSISSNNSNNKMATNKKILSAITIIGILGTIAFIIYQSKGLWNPLLNEIQITESNSSLNKNQNSVKTINNDANQANNTNNLSSSVAMMQENTDIVAIPSVSQALNNQVTLPELQQKNAEAAIDTSTLTSSTAVNAPTLTTAVLELKPVAQVSPSQVRLKMEIGTQSWISIKAGEKSNNLIRETKNAGSLIETIGDLPLKFSIRNPSTIKIFCNGKPYLIDEQKIKKQNADFTITSC